MLNLMLLRHAKSSWATAGQRDFDRPLNGRGQRAAAAMGRYMASQDLVPQLLLCSPAKRARETLSLLAKELKAAPETLVVPEIYDFGDGKALIKCLRDRAGAAQSVLLVGHNPAIGALAQNLAGGSSGKFLERLHTKYPTAALAVISFDLDNWQSLEAGSGTLLRFVTPKDLGVDKGD